MPNSRPVNVGFIGLSATGWAASTLAPALLDPRLKDHFRLVAVSTSSPVSAEASAKKYTKAAGREVKAYSAPGSNIYTDPEVDLIVISVKAPLHKELSIPALERGKTILIEWPVGRTLQETIDIGEVARKNGISKPFVNLNARNSLVVRKIKQLVDSGAIGKIISSTFVATTVRENGLFVPWVQPTYRYTLDKEQGASLLIICVGHQLDAITFALGDFKSITASATQQFPTAAVLDSNEAFKARPTSETVPNTTSDHYTFSGQLENGAHSSIIWRAGAKAVPGRKVLLWEIDGDEGSIRVESGTTPFMQIGNPEVYLNGKKVDIEGIGGNGTLSSPAEIQVHSWEEFAKGPENGTYASIEDAIKVKKVLMAVEQSASEGRAVIL